MNGNGAKERIYVTPGHAHACIVIPGFTLVALMSADKGQWTFSVILLILILFQVIQCKSRRIIAGRSGIIFEKLWGENVEIHYSQITRIEVVFRYRKTTMEFFVGADPVGQCYSDDANFDVLLKFLREKMPERIDFLRSPL